MSKVQVKIRAVSFEEMLADMRELRKRRLELLFKLATPSPRE